MISEKLKELVIISAHVGIHPDLVQGGGGNTSVKIDQNTMAVKASGFQLKDLTTDTGFVVVSYPQIVALLNEIDLHAENAEKSLTDFVAGQVINHNGTSGGKRPSMETGFHSLLDSYVIHTHSVYANVINCSKNGENLLQDIFRNTGYNVQWVPYMNPGFSLSWYLNKTRNDISDPYLKPNVIFLQNHGLIVCFDEMDACIKMHDDVNDILKKYLSISSAYPEIALTKLGENEYRSENAYLNAYLKNNPVNEAFFQNVLFPDQVVYFSGNFSFSKSIPNKINIDVEKGVIIYHTNEKEAFTIEETLLAYIYILEGIHKAGLSPLFISEGNISYINNMESEKYRKSLLKKTE